VGLPLGSWYYLRIGLDYRLDRLEKLQPKGVLTSDHFELGWVHVIAPTSATITRLDPIKDYFSTNPKLKFKIIDDLEFQANEAFALVWQAAGKSSSIMNGVFLTDTSNQIIGAYQIDDEGELAELSEDIAFILPPEPERDFEFKREQER
jgi:hypothetical protein